jgi:hypothetical protein
VESILFPSFGTEEAHSLDGEEIDLLSLPDLVTAKKTQRDKDWPMIRRLVETNYVENHIDPTNEQLNFWFSELRSPELLVTLAKQYPDLVPLVDRDAARVALLEGNALDVSQTLHEEEQIERASDAAYWEPLRKELATLRRTARQRNS